MSKSRKHASRGVAFEQKESEIPNEQFRQFEKSDQTETLKKNRDKSGKQGKSPKLIVNFKLSNGKILRGTCVNSNDTKRSKSKLFFPIQQKRYDGSLKDFCIPSPVDIRNPGGSVAIIEDVNDFLKDIHEQALAEFPEWLEKWGCRANENNPLLSLDEIREEWKYKKGQFGIFRLAAQSGFFTSPPPLKAKRLEVVDIEISNFY
jgi:hypothetical protein